MLFWRSTRLAMRVTTDCGTKVPSLAWINGSRLLFLPLNFSTSDEVTQNSLKRPFFPILVSLLIELGVRSILSSAMYEIEVVFFKVFPPPSQDLKGPVIEHGDVVYLFVSKKFTFCAFMFSSPSLG